MNLKIANIPLLNPVRFRGSLVDSYFKDSIPFFEAETEHFQPWKQGDVMRIQIYVSSDYVNLTLPEKFVSLCDCNTGLNGYYFTPEVIRYVTGTIWNYTFVLNVPVITGDHFVKIKLPYITNDGFYYWYSEGLKIKATWEGTVLLKYTCDGIFHDMFFEDLSLHNIEFYHRFKGGFRSKDFTPSSNSNVYADQSHALTLLSAIPYNTKKLTIGDNQGVPNYEVDFLNRAFCCQHITIDGVEYCKTETGIEQGEYSDRYPKGVWKIELAETPNDESITYTYSKPVITDIPVVIFDIPNIPVTPGQYDVTVINLKKPPSAYPAIAVLIGTDGNTYPIPVQINSATQIALNLTDLKPDTYTAKLIY